MDWDEEAQVQAIEQARELAERDPDASQLLAAHAMAQPTHATPNVYDPAQTEAALLLVAGLKPWEGDAMHFVRYFALVREVTLAKERERDEMQKQQQQSSTTYDSSAYNV